MSLSCIEGMERSQQTCVDLYTTSLSYKKRHQLSTFSSCQKVLCSQTSSFAKVPDNPTASHSNQFKKERSLETKWKKTKTGFWEAWHIINNIALHWPGEIFPKVYSVRHYGLSDIDIYSIKQRKRVCDEISLEILWVKQIYLLQCF